MSRQPLFTPYRMGDLGLPNRIVMAPLTRMRAQSKTVYTPGARGYSDYPTWQQAESGRLEIAASQR